MRKIPQRITPTQAYRNKDTETLNTRVVLMLVSPFDGIVQRHMGRPGLVVTIFTQSSFFTKICKVEILLNVIL